MRRALGAGIGAGSDTRPALNYAIGVPQTKDRPKALSRRFGSFTIALLERQRRVST
jgi:hypothetical protein